MTQSNIYSSVVCIDNKKDVVSIDNMKAKLIIDTRQIISENAFVELRVWEVPNPVRASLHYFKYGVPYTFASPEQLLADFWDDVDNWRP